jgi:hypothetical protein
MNSDACQRTKRFQLVSERIVGIPDKCSVSAAQIRLIVRNSGHHNRPLRVSAYVFKTNTSRHDNLIQEQVHRLRREQLPVNGRRNWIELSHVICPCEFNLKSPTSSIVAKAADLKIFNRLTFDVQRFDAVETIANPIPAAGAPVEVGIEMARHQAGSTSVFSRISRRRFGHLAGCSRMYSVTLGSDAVTRSRMLSKGISAPSGLQCSQDSMSFRPCAKYRPR